MDKTYLSRHPLLKDMLSVVVFVVCVALGTMLINNFIFRSFSVLGPSMETTFYTGDRLIVSRLPVTASQLQNKPYLPDRGQIIVFKNPTFVEGAAEEYIVKRVMAFPGERVVVDGGVLTVYNNDHPGGFEPDNDLEGPGSPTSGSIDTIVADGTIFVAGDHRQGQYSLDSRNGLGTVPLFDIIGPVSVQLYPFDKIRFL